MREEEKPSLAQGAMRETDRDRRVIEIINREVEEVSGRVKGPQDKEWRGGSQPKWTVRGMRKGGGATRNEGSLK